MSEQRTIHTMDQRGCFARRHSSQIDQSHTVAPGALSL